MPCISGDWRVGADYDYFDQLSPEQTAFEFLRRDKDYAASYAALNSASVPPSPATKDFSEQWGLRFAIDPALHGDEVSPIWLAKLNPRLALLTQAPASLVEGPALSDAKPVTRAAASEGVYSDLTRLTPPHQALIVSGFDKGPLALVVPMDPLFIERLETARRLWSALTRATAVPHAGFTTQRRRRLKLCVRALDGRLTGADYRDVACGLFDERVPGDAQWRTSSIRGQTIRLVKDGLALMRGGYLRLLRPDRRQR